MRRFPSTLARRLLLAALLPAAALAGASIAQAQGRQDFELVNRTGYEIREVYVGATRSTEWGRDVLGQGVLPANARRQIRFSARTRDCMFDIKVVYSDDDSTAEWRNLDLCSISRISLFWDSKRQVSRAEWE
ncbi:argininosuccinate lyase [Roseomonas sp. GC11]|uniref:argininosuccinate lyase n=1 Tax=Roseomonas sp. GC11 TaxID=2950546 RepID=UPI00210D7251|nr:argininosuccinate lyase [Roseomonas sp. GC11]MCQ4161326.1 argininosuccinate lyase [Roseomonas sp. GC11]